MNFTIDKSDIIDELSLVAGATEKRNTLPILSGILLEVAGGELSLSAGTMDQSVRALRIAVDQSENGSAVVDAGRLLGIVKSCKDGPITFTLDSKTLSVKLSSGAAKFSLPGFDPAEFAALPEPGDGALVQLPCAALLDAIAGISWCMSTDETRTNLCGIYFDKDRVIATNGHVLGMAEIAYSGDPFLLPAGAVKHVQKLCQSGLAEITLQFGGARTATASFTVGDLQLTARLTEGAYPDYRQVIPKTKINVSASRDEILGAMSRVANVVDKAGKVLNMDLDDGCVKLFAVSSDGADGSDTVEVEGGEPLELSFNLGYMHSAVAAMPETFTMAFLEAVNPMRVVGGNREFIVMPMRR